MKYLVFRSFGNLEKDVRKHALVAVEYGSDIDSVTDKLIKAINDDAIGLEKYQHGYTVATYAPELVNDLRRVKRYKYMMDAVLYPEYGEHNDMIEYGIVEEPETA